MLSHGLKNINRSKDFLAAVTFKGLQDVSFQTE